MDNEISLHSIHIDGNTYFIQADFKVEYCCNVLLTNAEAVWRCSLMKLSIVSFAKETGMELNEYYSLLKAAFTGKPLHKVKMCGHLIHQFNFMHANWMWWLVSDSMLLLYSNAFLNNLWKSFPICTVSTFDR